MRFILFFLLLPLSAYAQNSLADAEDWQVHKYKKTRIEYPANWGVLTENISGAAYALVKLDSEREEGFTENINLMLEQLPGDYYTLEGYVALSKSNFGDFLKEADILDDREVPGNPPYHVIEFTLHTEDFTLRTTQNIWVIKDMAYVLTAMCTVEQFDDVEAEMKKITSTFRVK